MRVRPLLRGFAAEVKDVDIGRIGERAAAELSELFRQYAVLVLPGQASATRDQLQDFAGLFGTPSGCSDITNIGDDDDIMPPESLDARYTRGNSLWHMDMLVLDKPPLAAMLLARELPTMGSGRTQFADLQQAWRSLPASRRRALRRLRAAHTIETIRRKTGMFDPDELRSEYSPGEHPLVCVDPQSGRPTLFFSAHTSHIVGASAEASAAVLDELLEIVTQDQHVYTHEWRLNDLLLWSNRRAMHRVLPYDHGRERRRLWRMEVMADERPSAVRPWWASLLSQQPQTTRP
jgi:alpha-ketoglutarate-dependent 2,4-dichlorophenoxyacetate dioxygenase